MCRRRHVCNSSISHLRGKSISSTLTRRWRILWSRSSRPLRPSGREKLAPTASFAWVPSFPACCLLRWMVRGPPLSPEHESFLFPHAHICTEKIALRCTYLLPALGERFLTVRPTNDLLSFLKFVEVSNLDFHKEEHCYLALLETAGIGMDPNCHKVAGALRGQVDETMFNARCVKCACYSFYTGCS